MQYKGRTALPVTTITRIGNSSVPSGVLATKLAHISTSGPSIDAKQLAQLSDASGLSNECSIAPNGPADRRQIALLCGHLLPPTTLVPCCTCCNSVNSSSIGVLGASFGRSLERLEGPVFSALRKSTGNRRHHHLVVCWPLFGLSGMLSSSHTPSLSLSFLGEYLKLET